MKNFLYPRDGASKGAALIIVLAMVVLLTGLCLAYFSRTTTERQLAQSSFSDTNADLLTRSALDIVVSDFKQEILNNPTVTQANIQPTRYGDAGIPNLIRRSFSGDPTGRTSNVHSTDLSANGRSISTTRWNGHYLVPLAQPNASPANSIPISDFTAPDWVLVTAQGPSPAPAPSAVIGRYAFAVYDEGGLLDMTLAGYPSWTGLPTGTCDPMPTPWQLNVGRKGIVTLADLTALPATPSTLSQSDVDKIVGWRNYATTLQTFSGFPSTPPSFTTDCAAQSSFGDYVLDFGEPPFAIDSYPDALDASVDPLTSVTSVPIPSATPRTDQGFMTRQELLKLRNTLGFSQNVLQYMGTFSRARNRPAPDWPWLVDPNPAVSHALTERWNMNNLDLVKPNPCGPTCQKCKRKKKIITCKSGAKKKGRGSKCGDGNDIYQFFGLWWDRQTNLGTTGYWRYVGYDPTKNPCDPNATFTLLAKIMPLNVNAGSSPTPSGTPSPTPTVTPGGSASAPHQNDFFQVLHFALWGHDGQVPGGDTNVTRIAKTFSVGASLIDQYDSDADDIDVGASPSPAPDKLTHTTIICFAEDCKADHKDPITLHRDRVAFGMETGDVNRDSPRHLPERPDKAPNPAPPWPSPTQSPGVRVVLNHAFSEVGEFGFAIDTSLSDVGDKKNCDDVKCPTLKLSTAYTLPCSTGNCDPAVLDFFSYNPVSSAYPRAGIVNLNTRNWPVLAAIIQGTVLIDASPTPEPIATPTPPIPSPTPPNASNIITSSTAEAAARAIVTETSARPALTRADVARLVAAANVGTDWQEKEAVARALTEIGGTRSWSLLIDVIAQTGKYKPNAPDLTGSNFVVEGEKRYWLHIAIGRDLKPDGTVDVIGTQLEEVVE
jgi:hypothetical protein